VVSVSFDQFLIGVMTVLSVAVFRQELNEGVASYGRVIGVGGLGVLLGTATVGAFEDRMTKPRIVALSFALAGVACVGASARIAAPTILLISFVLGLTYPWRKVPADTIVQETVPNRYRGRVFALYDAAFALPRVLAALAAIPVIPRLSTGAVVAVTGVLYLLWTPVLPAWVRRPRWVGLRFYAGGRAEEVPRGLVVGGEEEPVEALGSWVVESASGGRNRRFRLRTADGWRLDVVEAGTGSRWRVAREVPPDGPPGRLVQVGDDAGSTPGP
jgi:MFS family permease